MHQGKSLLTRDGPSIYTDDDYCLDRASLDLFKRGHAVDMLAVAEPDEMIEAQPLGGCLTQNDCTNSANALVST